MLQHAAEPNVRHRNEKADDGTDVVVVRARAPLKAGQELLNCYGEHSEATFLTRFGFVPGYEVGEYVKTAIKDKQPGFLGFRPYTKGEWGVGEGDGQGVD